jgi:putative membrane protein
MMWGSCPWCGGSTAVGTSPWGIGLFVFFGLLVIVGIILLVVWAARSSGRRASPGGGQPTGADSALESARHRYARGEIDKEEFDEIRRTLTGG